MSDTEHRRAEGMAGSSHTCRECHHCRLLRGIPSMGRCIRRNVPVFLCDGEFCRDFSRIEQKRESE